MSGGVDWSRKGETEDRVEQVNWLGGEKLSRRSSFNHVWNRFRPGRKAFRENSRETFIGVNPEAWKSRLSPSRFCGGGRGVSMKY